MTREELYGVDGPRCGDSCPPGWRSIVDHLLDQIALIAPEGMRIEQCKEKFGSLRLYTNMHDEAVEALIDEASLVCERTCMFCGRIGEREVVRGWIRVSCGDHP